MRRRDLLLRAVALVLLSVVGAAQAATMSLEDALRALEARGERFIYSTDLVRPDMRVEDPLAAGDAESVARDILAPHGLTVRRGAGGALIVVRLARAPASSAGPGGAVEPPRFEPEYALDLVDVTASSYQLMAEQGTSGAFLSRDDVERLPHLGNDPFRALDAVPGLAGGDFSATFNVRGGAVDETLVVLDGLPLYEPFHLKNLQNALSIIDARAVTGLEVMTGGYPAQYGDRMSGVLDITTVRPSRDARDELGLSFVTAHALLQGGLGDGDWMLSVRRGYLDVILGFVDPGGRTKPKYADAYFRTQHAVGSASTLSFHLLGAHDAETFEGDGNDEFLEGSYGSAYGWMGLHTDWSTSLRSSSYAYLGRVTRSRAGDFDKDLNQAMVDDERVLEVRGLKQDWSLDLGSRNVLHFGGEARDLRADYDYSSLQIIDNPLLTGGGPPVVTVWDYDLLPEGRQYAAYLSDRQRLGDALVIELGMRWDRQSWTAAGGDTQLSPRVNLRWDWGQRGVLKAGWGHFYQAQGLHELQVEDGVSAFQPAEQAEHRIVSWEGALGSRTTLRLEAYLKDYHDVRVRFENLFDPIQLFPEAEPDRVRVAPDSARAKGVEVMLRREVGESARVWFGYVHSTVEDNFAGRDVPRSWDQPDAINTGFEVGRGGPWDLTVNLLWHSGWPTTDLDLVDVPVAGGGTVPVFVTGPRNAERFGSYTSLNLRYSRRAELADSRLVWYLEISNLLNSQNECCVDGFNFRRRPDGSWQTLRDTEYWLPFVPSFGVRWEF